MKKNKNKIKNDEIILAFTISEKNSEMAMKLEKIMEEELKNSKLPTNDPIKK